VHSVRPYQAHLPEPPLQCPNASSGEQSWAAQVRAITTLPQEPATIPTIMCMVLSSETGCAGLISLTMFFCTQILQLAQKGLEITHNFRRSSACLSHLCHMSMRAGMIRCAA
jgi:hypothetical protein